MPGEHSPLGASGAERWMMCPGSVKLLTETQLPDSDEEDYQAEGTALHEAAAYCLRNDADAWEISGQKFYGITIDNEMAEAVQTAVDSARLHIKPNGKVYVEHKFSSPVHPDFWGTLDFGVAFDSLLVVQDHKFGKGIAVEVERNPQLMYYGYGLLQHYPGIRRVVLKIAQPRAYHVDGPIRRWETTAEEICTWVHDTLVPAMEKAKKGGDLDAGPWCRFCPAKLVCPLLGSLFETACTYDPKKVPALDDVSLGQSVRLASAVEKYVSALEKEALRRLNTGTAVSGLKLVHKRARRVWRKGAEEALKQRFGDAVIDPPSLKSPAQVEDIHPDAKKFVSTYAYTPESGLTVALEEDSRVGVKIQAPSATFAKALEDLSDVF